jgi:thioesterase domain-containing protein
LAERYADFIAFESGNEPVHLVGYSIGGLAAFQTVRIVSGRKNRIASLTLIDTLDPRWTRLGLAAVAAMHRMPGLLSRFAGIPVMRRFAEMALDERLLRQLGMAVSYRPVAWRGRLHFISCTFSAWAGGLRSGEWRASAAALDVMKVPGSHSSIFQEPGIRTLAASLDAIFSANEIPKER